MDWLAGAAAREEQPTVWIGRGHQVRLVCDVAGEHVSERRWDGDGRLALVTQHPGQVHTLIPHEPPLIELLPDKAQLRAAIDDLYDTYRSDGPRAAMEKFFAVTGGERGPAPVDGKPNEVSHPEPSTPTAEMPAHIDYFLARMVRPITRFRPDVAALRAASTRIVVAGGTASKGQLPYRGAVALADQLDTTVVDFPGGHGGFVLQPEPFAGVLRQVLTEAMSKTP